MRRSFCVLSMSARRAGCGPPGPQPESGYGAAAGGCAGAATAEPGESRSKPDAKKARASTEFRIFISSRLCRLDAAELTVTITSLSGVLGERQGAVKNAVIGELCGNDIAPRAGPGGHLALQFLAQRVKQALPGFTDAATDDDASRIEQHDGSLEAAGKRHDILAHEIGIVQELFCGASEVALEP